ncbi:MAG: alkaline phosphatase family protein [Alphaproteobacteria bacterium]|nr:alkaline phosphatase family protein [Alphaproteobacteria bacterium]
MADRVLIVSFDALRPEMATAELMPNLSRFAADGARFRRSRSTFPTETRVNQTALIAGCYPARHGIVGNRFLDAAASPDALFNTGDETQLSEGDRRLGGKLVDVPVLGELLADAGLTYAVISTGTAGGTRMLHHKAEAIGGFRLSLQRPDATVPAGAIDEITRRFGPIPPAAVPSLDWLGYATDVYLDYIEPELAPDVMVLWYCEPDNSYHQLGIGSAGNIAALRRVDAEFGRILGRQDMLDPEDRLHIVTMSDHGMVTIAGGRVDIAAELEAAGFSVGETTFEGADSALALSSAGGIYVRDSDPELIARIRDWLQAQPWCGVLSTRTGEGTLRHADLGIDHPRAPDIGLVLGCDDAVNQHGHAGSTLLYKAKYPDGGGMHGGLSAIELSTWLAIGGPAAAAGANSDLPAGNVDLLPTILHLLGLHAPDHIEGRVLREGLAEFAGEAPPEVEIETLSAEGAGGYRAHLTVERVGGTRYLQRAWID